MSETDEASPDANEQTAAPAKPRGPRPIFIIAGFAVLAIAGLLVWHFVHVGKESTDDATVQADVVPLSLRVSGQVAKLLVHENQTVKAGDPILQLDDADYVARLKEQQATYDAAVAQATAADAQLHVTEETAHGNYSSAEAQVLGSSTSVRSAAAQITAARAATVRAQSEDERTNLDLQRAKELFGERAVPKQQLDNARTAFEAARAALEQSRAQLTATKEDARLASDRVREAEGRLGVSRPVEAQIATARANAQLAHAKADSEAAKLNETKLQLQYTQLYAPGNGVVSSVGAFPGQYLQAGQPVAQFVPDSTYVVANFKETQLDKMRIGQRVVIRVDAFPGRKLEGRIESFAGGTGSRFALLPPDNATGNFVKIVQRVPVRVAWSRVPTDLPLHAGLSVEVTVHEKEQAAPQAQQAPGPST